MAENQTDNGADAATQEWAKLKETLARMPTVSGGVIAFAQRLKETMQGWEGKPQGPSAEEVRVEREQLEKHLGEITAAIVVNTDAEERDPLTVPSKVPGQPPVTYPGGVELEPFPTDGFPRDVDMSAPQPQGNDPVTPSE